MCTTSCFASFLSYLVHVLPHRTNIVIFIYIIIKVLREKAVLFKCLFLFFMKVVELYKWLNIIYLHKDRKSTRLNSSHVRISYAVFCLKKKKKKKKINEKKKNKNTNKKNLLNYKNTKIQDNTYNTQ